MRHTGAKNPLVSYDAMRRLSVEYAPCPYGHAPGQVLTVGTSDENESGGAFATRRTVTISIQNGLHKYYVYNHMYRASTCS